MRPQPPTAPLRRGRFSGHVLNPARLSGLLVALLVLIGTAPTLSWLEFSGSMENLNVATVLEMHRTGRWLVPTLEGNARLNKPPLTAWVTSLFVSDELVDRLSEAPLTSELAYRELTFRIRLSPLIQTCLTMLLIAGIARVIFGDTGAIAAAVYGTSLLVLKIGHAATTDVLMTLWIAVAQVGVALWLFRGLRWRGAVLIGVGTGLALMSKGPVCLLFIVLPAIGFRLLDWLFCQTIASSQEAAQPYHGPPARAGDVTFQEPQLPEFERIQHGPEAHGTVGPLVLAIILTLAIGTPWFIYVLAQHPEVVHGWTTEVTRVGATENAGSNPAFYLSIIPLTLPWLPFAIIAGAEAVGDLRRRRITPLVYLLIASVLPLVVMSFFPDRKDRYALPAMIPLAVLAAYGVRARLADARAVRIWFVLLFLVALALPIAGATGIKRIDGTPWFSPTLAIGAAAAMVAVIVAGLAIQERRPTAVVIATVILLLIAQALGTHGYAYSRSGKSEMKPLADAIRAEFPRIGPIINARPDRKRISVDLAIYLNRATTRVPDWKSLPLSDPPAVAIIPQRAGEPKPVAPPGWRELTNVPRDKDRWYAFVQTK